MELRNFNRISMSNEEMQTINGGGIWFFIGLVCGALAWRSLR